MKSRGQVWRHFEWHDAHTGPEPAVVSPAQQTDGTVQSSLSLCLSLTCRPLFSCCDLLQLGLVWDMVCGPSVVGYSTHLPATDQLLERPPVEGLRVPTDSSLSPEPRPTASWGTTWGLCRTVSEPLASTLGTARPMAAWGECSGLLWGQHCVPRPAWGQTSIRPFPCVGPFPCVALCPLM